MSETIVIFRKDMAGEPFALFPELPGDDRGFFCTGYQHFGRYVATDYDLCIARSTPAAPIVTRATRGSTASGSQRASTPCSATSPNG
jgi:hypothetical protein